MRLRNSALLLSHFLAWNEVYEPRFYSSGAQALILHTDNKIWKISKDSYDEMTLLMRLDSDYIIKAIGGISGYLPEDDGFLGDGSNYVIIGFEMEYINGKTLEEHLDNLINEGESVMKYSQQIISGLKDMVDNRIYQHRDIRPANIMYDSDKDRMVIIDLGIATMNPHEGPKDNRGYGGPHDLVSMGQLIYKMYTGNHLFADCPEMEKAIYRGKIKAERDRVYEEAQYNLLPYFEKIDKNIGHDRLNKIIKACLTADKFDHEKIIAMYEGFDTKQ